MRLGELVSVRKGKKPEVVVSATMPGYRRLLQIDDLRPGASPKFCPPARGEVIAETSDVIIAWDGANAATSGFGLTGAIGSTLALLRPVGDDVFTPYLGRFIRSQKRYLRERCQGATVPHIDSRALKALELPLPPLAEQRRIAEVLDRAEALRSYRRAAIAQLDTLTQSIFLDMFGDPTTNPKGWASGTPLGDVSEIVSGITVGRQLNGQQVRAVRYLAVINVQDKALDLSVEKTIDATEDEIRRYRLRADDLLLTEGGDPDKLGRGTLWKDEVPECIHQNHIFRVRLTSDKVDPLFLNWLVGSKLGKRYFLKSAKQTTGIASINMTQLRGFPLLIPPMAVQREFARRIAAAGKLRSTHEASLGEFDALFTSLQDRAFTAEL